ncbi:MAG: pyruvate kinase [Candidatus Aminicenantes bacterium]|nr:pyruvate kinase [Candidatus Aminicenantes bacterium]
MKLSANKTKIICTIGPSSESPAVMEKMIGAGMNVARLNLAHGHAGVHEKNIENLRLVARSSGRRLAILADLPGPKIRIGILREPLDLKTGDHVVLTTGKPSADALHIPVNFDRLPQVVKPGDIIFLNDGFIQLEVSAIDRKEVRCQVLVGGELRSGKGLNLPGKALGISAFTDKDADWLRFAFSQQLDALGLSFVESAADIIAVRQAAACMGYQPFIIAKIERLRALDNMAEILEAADGIMIARGDLGVEIPIEQIAVVQKQLVFQANLLGKPVITATQMLESMTANYRPTRAEVTDVANAILDGTDCVMLSEETALGKYPVEAVAMLAKIAEVTEPQRPGARARETLQAQVGQGKASHTDVIALSMETILQGVALAAVMAPTLSGATARNISRFRLPLWIAAVSPNESTCQQMQFSYGIHPVHEADPPADWKTYAGNWLQSHGVKGNIVLLIEGPSPKNPGANYMLEMIDLERPPQT